MNESEYTKVFMQGFFAGLMVILGFVAGMLYTIF